MNVVQVLSRVVSRLVLWSVNKEQVSLGFVADLSLKRIPYPQYVILNRDANGGINVSKTPFP